MALTCLPFSQRQSTTTHITQHNAQPCVCIPQHPRGGSVGVPWGFRGVPWGFRVQAELNCSTTWALPPMRASSRNVCVFHSRIGVWRPGKRHAFLAHGAVGRPSEIGPRSLRVRQKGGAGPWVAQTCKSWVDRWRGPEVSFLEFYGPRRFPAVGRPQLLIALQRHIPVPPALLASRGRPCPPADKTGASWSPGTQKPTTKK